MDEDLVAALDRVARRQHGVVTFSQATGLLGRSRLRRWAADGRLERAQPRTYRLAGTPRTWHQQLASASLSAGGPVSHRSAAALWDLIEIDEAIAEVSVRPPRKPTLQPPGTVHRIRDLDRARVVPRAGLEITDPMRTIVDLGLVLPWPAVDAAIGRGIRARLFSAKAVERERERLGKPGRNGTGVARRALDERLLRAAPEDSEVELRLLRALGVGRLPSPRFQYEVWHDGRFLARVDAAFPELRLALEVDGYGPHSTPEAFQRDRERQNRLVALGWTVLRFTWHDVVRRPRAVAAEVTTTYERLCRIRSDYRT